MVAAAAVVIGRRLGVLSSHPVVGLLDAFSPLRRGVPSRFSRRLTFVSLHDDSVQAHHHLFFDVGDAATDAAHADQVRLGVERLWASQCDDRVEGHVLAGQRADF